ncbi:CBS domain-containing protein [Dyella sp.]|uniref:CBS domain-containing protein n=1 Tax=Dyella sp. TaxID=1869338 RepID=UPI002ED0B377
MIAINNAAHRSWSATMRAQQIGHSRVIHIQAKILLTEATRIMRQHQIGCLVVTEAFPAGDLPIGILTHRDVVFRACAVTGEVSALTVGEVMSSPAVCCRTDHSVDELVAIMLGSGKRRLPMIDDAGHLVGLVCSNDVLGAIGELLTGLALADGAGGSQDRMEI